MREEEEYDFSSATSPEGSEYDFSGAPQQAGEDDEDEFAYQARTGFTRFVDPKTGEVYDIARDEWDRATQRGLIPKVAADLSRPGRDPVTNFQAFGAGVASEIPFFDEAERFITGRETSRAGEMAEQAWDEDEAPFSYGLGKFLGAVGIPGAGIAKAGKAARYAATAGKQALDAYGQGLTPEGMDAGERIKRGSIGAAVGGLVGGAGRAAGEYAAPALTRMANSRASAALGGNLGMEAQRSIAETFGGGDFARGAQRYGAEADRLGLIPKTAGMPFTLRGNESLLRHAERTMEKPGQEIGGAIERADATRNFTGTNLQTVSDFNRLLDQKVTAPGQQGATATIRREFGGPLNKLASQYRPIRGKGGKMVENPAGPFTLGELAMFKNKMRPEKFAQDASQSEAGHEAVRFLQNRVNEGVKRTSTADEFAAYTQAQRDYLPAKKASQYLNKSVARDAGNSDLSLRGAMVGATGGLPAQIAFEGARRLGNQNASLLSRAASQSIPETIPFTPSGSYERLGRMLSNEYIHDDEELP